MFAHGRYHRLTLLLLLFSPSINCQLAQWIYPGIAAYAGNFTGNMQFQVGSTQTLEWTSPYPTANISWFHNDDTGSDVSGPVVKNMVGSTLKWVVDVGSIGKGGIDIDRFPVFYFLLTTYISDANTTVGSHYFNLTRNVVVSSTSTLSTSKTTSSVSSTTRVETGSSTSTASPMPRSGISPGASAGIAIACVLVVGIIVAGIWFLRQAKKLRKQNLLEVEKTDDQWTKTELDTSLDHRNDVTKSGFRSEMDGGSGWVHEMSSTPRVFELPAVMTPRELRGSRFSELMRGDR